ncbi:hypothetical protein E0Z08_09840 [Acinetobacter johnsonii]|nr:hypothetical protein DT536_13235 [Acinetobacter johnsonii]QBK69808.1 hypothetical protein E0Z08_09840 [Acinetobacter johnsonii]
MSTHNVLSYAKRIDDICLGEWWQSKNRRNLSFFGYHRLKLFALDHKNKAICILRWDFFKSRLIF